MGYRSVLTCFLLVLLAGCTFDDGDDPNEASATAEAGEDIVLDIGVARLEINRFAIGPSTGQIEPGSEVILKVDTGRVYADRDVYSPVIHIQVKDPDGEEVTGFDLTEEAVLELSYNFSHANEDGNTAPLDLVVIRDSGGNVDELTYSTAPTPDDTFTLISKGRARVLLSDFARFAVSAAEEETGLPEPTALTGTASTVVSSTTFQLADEADEFDVNVAIPSADTSTPPAVLTLNDASFDAGNPLAPNNRIITVEFEGNTYSSDRPGASVLFQLDTFSESGSSGSITGTVIQQGGSQSLDINFTFTTSAAPAVALAGLVTESGGRRTITLQDATGAEQVVIVVPDSLPNAALDPVDFDDDSFDGGNPSDASNRAVIVFEGGDTFSSDVPTIGDVTITFSSWNDGTLTGDGTIEGSVASPSPATKTLNYTFEVTGGETAAGSLTAGTADDISSDQADESAVVFDGVDYVAVWLSDVGTTNRTLEFLGLDPDTLSPGTQESFEPAADLDPAAGLHAASDAAGNVLVVGATGTDDGADEVTGVLYDYVSGALVAEFTVGTGTNPRVVYNGQADAYVIAYESSGDVAARAYDATGTPVDDAVTVTASATLKGLASAGGTTDEALITVDDGSGIVGQYVVPGTGALNGGNFDLSTNLSGGLCAWDEVGGQYVVLLQDTVQSAFTIQTAVALAAGTSTPVGSQLSISAGGEFRHAAGEDAGVIILDASANLFPLESDTGGPALVAGPIVGVLEGLALDDTSDGAPLAAAGSGRYLMLAARGGDGVTAVPLTLTP